MILNNSMAVAASEPVSGTGIGESASCTKKNAYCTKMWILSNRICYPKNAFLSAIRSLCLLWEQYEAITIISIIYCGKE